MEGDIDEEIQTVKINYENQLKFLNEYANRLTITVCKSDFKENWSSKEILQADFFRIQMRQSSFFPS
jgi:hypothetical protein